MNKETVTNFFKGIRATASKHSPEILTGVGITGMVVTAVLAVRATPKALRLIDDYKETVLEDYEEPTKVEIIKVAWKPYMPAVALGACSVACLIGANSVHAKRNAAIMTAYQLSTTALKEYREKVVETIGEKKEKTVHDKLAKDKIEKNPVNSSTVIISDKGNTLCFDIHSGRYFKSDIDRIKRAVNELNYRMNAGMEMYISLNEFYDAIGLPQTPIGEELGWRIDKGLIDIHFSAQMTDEGVPCATIEYLVPPEYGFNKLY